MSNSAPVTVVERGEIYWLDWNPARGSEQAGRRPVLVVQTDVANLKANYPLTIVVAVSTKGRPVPLHIVLEPSPENGLPATSYAKCEQLLTVSKARLVQRVGKVDVKTMTQIDAALKQVLALSYTKRRLFGGQKVTLHRS
jgi:mRNA interferase MazF